MEQPRLRDARGTSESLRPEGEFRGTATNPAMAPFQRCVQIRPEFEPNTSTVHSLAVTEAVLPTTVIRLKWILNRRTFPAGD